MKKNSILVINLINSLDVRDERCEIEIISRLFMKFDNTKP